MMTTTSNSVRIVLLNSEFVGGKPNDELDVPEEPEKDDDDEDDETVETREKEEKKKKEDDGGEVGRGRGRDTPLTFFTAAGIARWMAKAYGYRARKRDAYLNHDSRRPSVIEGSSLMEVKEIFVSSSLEYSRTATPLRHVDDDEWQALVRGDPKHLSKAVSEWVATSYGQMDEAYHAALSKQMLREARGVDPSRMPVWAI